MGNKLYQEDLRDPQGSELYRYDELDRLTTWKRGELSADKTEIPDPVASQSWELDSVGNWQATTIDGQRLPLTVNDMNEITGGKVQKKLPLSDFVLFGETKTHLGPESHIISGNVGSNAVGGGYPLQMKRSGVADKGVTLIGPDGRVREAEELPPGLVVEIAR
ncbi:MAG: hypothetical protein ACLFWL_04265 [Candidatus Brocadiia bacterium]